MSEIDAYIAASAGFARPLLAELRARVHRALPGVEEAMRWGKPHFVWHGRNLAGMAAFKAHASFFFHGEPERGGATGDGMGHYGRMIGLADLPGEAEFAARLHAAAARLDSGAQAARPARTELETPADLAGAIAGHAPAQAAWDGFAPSHRRDYIEWITEAKTAATRDKRLAQTLEWLAEGKRRNWKYER